MNITRLLAINGFLRIGNAGTGQLFAFLMAERMRDEFGVGALLVGLLGAAFFLTELLGAPFAGDIADRVGQRRVLRWGPIFGVVSASVAASTALNIASLPLLILILLFSRLSEGASAACAVPTTLTLLSRATDGDAKRRTRVMGAFEVTSLLGMILGYIVVGVAWDAFGTSSFLILPPIYGIAWVLTSSERSGPERKGIATETRDSVFAVLQSLAQKRKNVAFALSWLSINAIVGLWLQQAPYLLSLPERSKTQDLVGGFSGQEIGIIFAAWGLSFLVGIVLWSVFAPVMRRGRAMAISLFGMLGVVACLFWKNHGGPTSILFFAVALIFIEAGYTPAAFAHLAEITRPLDASRGAALGLYSVLLGTGQLGGNLLGGVFAAAYQMDGVLGLTVLLAISSLIGVWGMERSEALQKQV